VNESAGKGERGSASEGIILGPGEGRKIPGTDAMTLKATSEQTGGSIGFLEATSSPGSGPPRHVHYSSDELFYVLEGEFLFLVCERQVSALPGTFVFIPRGRSMPLRLLEPGPARCLRPTYLGAWSTPSRSSPSCGPSSKEETRIGARAEAGKARRR
jgi:mannose-6-phosphate isomerase-like protein (cupin superfamily)